jgi:mycothiol synthase
LIVTFDVFRAAEEFDGVSPINESATLVLEGKRPGRVIEREFATAVADLRDGTIQLAVHPEHRREGRGTALLRQALAEHPELTVWAFGSLPGSAELAAKAGLVPTRTLLRMARPLPADEEPDADTTITGFRPEDADRIVEINALSFAHHPEQGKLTKEEFDDLTRQPWFSAEGLKVAREGDEPVGFHWTKRHGGGVGEVYVLAVHPEHGGKGLGRALLAAGLRHLYDEGDREVILYVEGSEERVVNMYRAAGFTVANRDTSYGREPA